VKDFRRIDLRFQALQTEHDGGQRLAQIMADRGNEVIGARPFGFQQQFPYPASLVFGGDEDADDEIDGHLRHRPVDAAETAVRAWVVQPVDDEGNGKADKDRAGDGPQARRQQKQRYRLPRQRQKQEREA